MKIWLVCKNFAPLFFIGCISNRAEDVSRSAEVKIGQSKLNDETVTKHFWFELYLDVLKVLGTEAETCQEVFPHPRLVCYPEGSTDTNFEPQARRQENLALGFLIRSIKKFICLNLAGTDR